MDIRKILVASLFVALCIGLCMMVVNGQEPPVKTNPTPAAMADPEPHYKGAELVRPEGYRTWIFVGANIGLRYKKDDVTMTPRESERRDNSKIGDFHNVYINPKAYEHFLRTGQFLERTILVMEVFQTEDQEPKKIVEAGFFPGARRDVEVAVKNSKRPDGAKEDWAYYIFPQQAKTAAAMPKSACYDCHRKHASIDNVWVQFYPTLRDQK